MINLKRLFDGEDPWTITTAIIKFENENLNLNEIKNEMFQKILKKYMIRFDCFYFVSVFIFIVL